jgi:NAD(P)-dependent dehydrogenase (short-subunit alcohol dehydrogenase family)
VAALLSCIVTPIDIVLSLVFGRRKVEEPKTIVITGATSGIGEGLAKSYARSGVTLMLTGRNAERLESVGAECSKLGASVITKIVSRKHAALVALESSRALRLLVIEPTKGRTGQKVGDSLLVVWPFRWT